MTPFVDSRGAISLIFDRSINRQRKLMDVCFYSIRKALRNGGISLKYCPTENMTGNFMEKSLGRVKFSKYAV